MSEPWDTLTLGIAQLEVVPDKAANLAMIEAEFRALAARGCALVAFPEMAQLWTNDAVAMRAAAEPADGIAVRHLQSLAGELGVALHIGSMLERDGTDFYNTSLLIDSKGRVAARYRKIHCFDVSLPDGQVVRESDLFSGGNSLACVTIDGVNVGLAICFDLRFPELFAALRDRGADLIVCPAAFASQTGADHWEPLLRARAIETQCYVAAPALYGDGGSAPYFAYGRSMVVDPWGTVIGQVSHGAGSTLCVLSGEVVRRARSRIPLAASRATRNWSPK